MMLNVIKIFPIFLLLLLTTPVIASDYKTMGIDDIVNCVNHDKECEESARSQYGELSVKTMPDIEFKLFFNKKEIARFEGYSVSIQEKFTIGKKDIFLLAVNSGGMACPMEMYIFEISDASSYNLSKSFGSCSDLYKAYIEKDALIIKNRDYFNPMHLNDLSPKEQKALKKIKEIIYKWSKSELTEKKDKKNN